MADQNNLLPGGLPPEYMAEIEAANRRRMLAQLLQKQAMGFQGAQSQGKMASKTSPLAWLANTASGMLGTHMDAKGAADISAVQTRAGEDMRKELSGVLSAPEDQQFSLGLQGKFSQTQALAKALNDQRLKKIELYSGALKETDPAAAAGAVAAGKIPGEYKPTPLPGPQFGTSPSGAGYGYTQDRKGVSHLSFEPKGNVTNIDNAGETAAAKALGGKLPERYGDVVGAAQKAISGLESAKQIQGLLSDPATITGFGAGVAEGVAALGAKMGFTGPDSAAKTQSLMSALAGSTLENVKRLPGAITEKERPFLELASSGKVSWTKEAIQRLADISAMANHNLLVGLNSDYQGLGKLPMARDNNFPVAYPFPQGWNFVADPKKYKETGTGTNRYSYIERPSAQAAPPKGVPKPANGTAYTLEEFQRYFGNIKVPGAQ